MHFCGVRTNDYRCLDACETSTRTSLIELVFQLAHGTGYNQLGDRQAIGNRRGHGGPLGVPGGG